MKTIGIIGHDPVANGLDRFFTSHGYSVKMGGVIEPLQDFDHARNWIERNGIEEVVFTGGLHDLDECERDSVSIMYANAFAAYTVAKACARLGRRICYISSDYVFSGSLPPPAAYLESAGPNPTTEYGKICLTGEELVQHCPAWLIVRTSWLFWPASSTPGGPDHFVRRIVRQPPYAKPIRAISDIRHCPTYIPHLAARIEQLLLADAVGVFHVTNNQPVTPYEFAAMILDRLPSGRDLLVGINQAAWNSQYERIPRPANTALATDRGAHLPSLEQAIGDYLAATAGS